MSDQELPQVDSQGHGPTFHKGDRVFVEPYQLPATVIRQMLHWDYPDCFWGNLELLYDDGIKGVSNCWQCTPLGTAQSAQSGDKQ